MKVYLVYKADIESMSIIGICSTLKLAEKKLFQERDVLIEEWKEMDKFVNDERYKAYKENNIPFEENNIYKNMIKNLSSDDYKSWDNSLDCLYISEYEVIEE